MARLGFVAGVIPQEKISAFERVLFRATRGNMFLKQVILLRDLANVLMRFYRFLV